MSLNIGAAFSEKVPIYGYLDKENQQSVKIRENNIEISIDFPINLPPPHRIRLGYKPDLKYGININIKNSEKDPIEVLFVPPILNAENKNSIRPYSLSKFSEGKGQDQYGGWKFDHFEYDLTKPNISESLMPNKLLQLSSRFEIPADIQIVEWPFKLTIKIGGQEKKIQKSFLLHKANLTGY